MAVLPKGFMSGGGDWPKWGDPLPWERLQEFERSLREQAWRDRVELPEDLKWDGKIHQFPGAGKGRGNTSARYLLRADWPPNGWYQDFTQGHDNPIPWKFDTRGLGAEYRAYQETPEAKEARKQYEARREQEKKEKEARDAAALQEASRYYERSPECPPSHAYFKRKGVPPPAGIKLDEETGDALLPLYDERGRFKFLQRLPAKKGVKKYAWCEGLHYTGAWFTSGPDITEGPILTCEGIATAASVYQCSESRYMTICATSSRNLKPVCEALRRKFPGRQIIIMADDDAKTAQANSKDGKPGKNPGMAAAAECLKERICDGICPPPFDRAQDGMNGSDWNDYHALYGEGDTAEALAKGITDALSKAGEPQSAAAKVKFETLADLWYKDFPPPRWAVEGVLPEGCSILAGAPKVGKSWFCLHVALSIAVGGQAFGSIDVAPGPVLYLSLEDRERRLQARSKEILREYHDGIKNFYFALDCPRQNEGGTEAIASWLEQHTDARLVIIDTLQKFRRRKKSGEDSYQADYDALAEIKSLADKFGVPVLIVHHTRKARDEAGDWLNDVSGTQGISGAADSTLVLRRARLSNTCVLGITGRDVEEAELALTRDDHGGWRLEGDADSFLMSQNKRRILDYLKKHGESTPKDVADDLEIKVGTAQKTLSRMAREGQVQQTRRGIYTVSEAEKRQG